MHALNIPYFQQVANRFFLMAGPCVVENESMPLEIASEVKELTDKLGIPYIFKASYRKANRSRLDSFTGIGDLKALKVMQKVREELHIPVVTDIHSALEAEIAAEYVDVLQIPAFLCRQTDILVAAVLSADSMRFAVQKVRESGNPNIMLTDRGTMLGYQDLVVDFRGIPVMQQNEVPVVLDITHSLQQPNQSKGVTGGQPQLIETIGKAGIAVGADGIFLETHPNPALALSDGANMLKLDLLEDLLKKLIRVYEAVH